MNDDTGAIELRVVPIVGSEHEIRLRALELGITAEQFDSLASRFFLLPVPASNDPFTELRDPTPRVRPTWDETWLRTAAVIADRAECTRSRVGAIVVHHNHDVWVGYNGAPAGEVHCTDGGCPRGKLGKDACPPGSDYGNCVALHAEVNALVKAGRGAQGAVLYVTRSCCDWCLKVARAAGIERVVYVGDDGIAADQQL